MPRPAPTPARRTAERRDTVHRRSGEAGFTLTELLITLVILVVVILGVLTMFDLNSRIARTQTHVAEMQQSQRVAQQSIIRLARMAGRGGLPTFDLDGNIQLPKGVALGIDNNVAASTTLGGCSCAQVMPGTDVLTVRGVFTAPIYISDPESTADFVAPAAGGGAGSIRLYNVTDSGAPQDLSELAQVVEDAAGGKPDALLLANALGEYAVVEITGGSTEPAEPAEGEEITAVTVNFVNSGGTDTTAFNKLSDGGSYPNGFQRIAYAGVLEEYRFFVRDRRTTPSDDTANPMPQLVRARFVPNTDKAYRNDTSYLTEVVADNILDLQLSFGLDRDGDGLVEEGAVVAASGGGGTEEGEETESLTPDKDEWLFNHTADDTTVGTWNVDGRNLYYLRITTLARTDRPTHRYMAEAIDSIEDNDWGSGPFARFNGDTERSYQRRQIRTVIDLRNL